MIYMVVCPIIIIALIILVIVYWKQKHDCEHKEPLCLCSGPQMVGHCKPYNLYSNLDIGVDSPRANKYPPPLKMPYDVLQYGYRRIRPDCN
jgi:hypothetical protein